MARKRDHNEEFEQTKRISPYQQIDEGDDQQAYEDEYADAYEDEYEDGYDEAEETGHIEGFFSTLIGKIVVGVIALLVVLLIVLVAVRILKKPDDAQQLPAGSSTAAPAQQTAAPASIVFAPIEETPEPTAEPTTAPTDEPEPTDTPLPIILTNTPTPSPTPTATPTPTPTLVPTPTPTPSPSPVPELSKGEVNRNANLRESASSSGKVKQTVKKGESVTVHEAVLDKSGKTWYRLTVDDQAVTGWMRDYVVDLEDKVAKPTYTPNPEATPKADEDETAIAEEDQSVETDEQEEPEKPEEPAEETLAVGETNRDANLRKSMNGTVLGTIKKGKSVSIYEVLKDKSGNTWYRLSVDDSGDAGYMRDFVIDLEDDVELTVETVVSKASVGTAKTNRAANVRKTPSSDSSIVRQISKGVKVYIMGKFSDSYHQIWYQISTETGNTTGFMRDYVLDNVKLDDGVETQTYSE